MRVLVDAHQLGLAQTGNETWVRNVLAGLADAGSDDDLHVAVTEAGRSELPAGLAPGRTHLVSPSSSQRLAFELPRLLRSLRPDALLVQYTLPPLTRVPGVVVVHDLSFERPEAKQWIPAASLLRYRTTIRASATRARRVLVPSEYTKADVVDRYGIAADRVMVAGNAVDPTLIAALAATRRAEPDDRLVVLAVGTVLPRKNLEVVATAVRLLRSQGLPVILRLVGPTPPGGRMALARMSARLGDSLEVTGMVSTQGLAQAYRSAHALAFPSLFEGFGIPLIEAMAAGTPVVSSDATCLPEIGGDAALYAPPDDPDRWAEALRLALIDRTTREALVVAGTERAKTFAWSRSAERTSRALHEAAA